MNSPSPNSRPFSRQSCNTRPSCTMHLSRLPAVNLRTENTMRLTDEVQTLLDTLNTEFSRVEEMTGRRSSSRS